MSNTKSLKDFLEESAKQLDYYDRQLSEYDAIISENVKNADHLEAQRQDVLLRMAQQICPSFSQEELDKIASALHNASIKNYGKEKEYSLQMAEKRKAEIENDPEYIRREHLLDPNTGDYIVEHKHMKDAYNSLVDELGKYGPWVVNLEWLIRDGYGTPDYKHKGILRFFNSQHLENWRLADMIYEAMGKNNFMEVREEYLSTKQRKAEIKDAMEHYEKKINYIRAMEKEHKQIVEAIPGLDDLYRKRIAKEMEAFLNSTSQGSKNAFFKAFPQLKTIAKTQEGLYHQKVYSQDLKKKLGEERGIVQEKRGKLATERARYANNQYKYGSKRFDAAKFQKRFNRNENYVQSKFKKYRKTNDAIYNFKSYNSAPSLLESFLWWDLISKNRIDGSFSPSVTNYYSSHTHDASNYVPEPQETMDADFSDKS